MVVIRLLRMAAAGLKRDAILAKLKARLPALHQTQVSASVCRVVFWSEREPQPLELLRQLEAFPVKNSEGQTVGSYIEQFEAELALVQARRAPKIANEPLAEEIVSVAVLGLEPDGFRERAIAVARSLGTTAVGPLIALLNKPDLPILQSRVPPTIPNHEAIWRRAIFEILGHLGAAALPAARSLVADDDEYIRELAIRLLCRIAAGEDGAAREAVVIELRSRLPSMAYGEIRDAVSRLVADVHAEPKIMEILESLADVQVKLSGDRTITVGEMVKARYVPPKPEPRSKKKLTSKRANATQCEGFARRFGAAVVARDFAAAQKMLCAPLQKTLTPRKLAQLVAKNSKHSGPPDAFEYSASDLTIAELRDGDGEWLPIPSHITESNFLHWCCIQFLPVEESDADACFDWWMAAMDEKGELKVGFFHILDPD
jgi:hypothetical protein